MAAPAHKEKGESRARILDGAAEEFASAGFAGARIDRIARRTKLNVRMIYYYFGSKKGLYRGVLEHFYEQAAQVVQQGQKSDEPAASALALYFDLLSGHPRFGEVLVRELLDGAKHLRALIKERPELFQKVHLDTRNLVQHAIDAKALKPEDPSMVVFSITSIICYLTAIRGSFALFTDGRRPDEATWKAHITGMLLDGLRGR
jgi:AcrR family transcriptional regulator